MKFFAACAKGLELLLVDELKALGAASAREARAGVEFEGEFETAWRAVLWSRLASRVLWPLAEFVCASADDLYDAVAAIDWQQHLAADGSLVVAAHGSTRALSHSQFAAQKVKDAIVDRLRSATGTRPRVELDDPDLRVDLLLRRDRGVLSLDLAGSLHRRGWRRSQGEAPLKETLAAAVLLRGGWPQLAAEGAALCDPMCGSGTLLIEGALIAADVAPGLQRHGAATPTRWLGFDAALWARLVGEARGRAAQGLAAMVPRFFGSDNDRQSIRNAQANAAAAGVADFIHFDCRDVGQLQAPGPARGLVVSNPPYDARLATDPALYHALGDALQRAVPHWRAALLCGDDNLARATGLRAQKFYQLFNGALECRLIVCDPVRSERPNLPVRPLSEGAQMVANRLRKNEKRLRAWRQREGVDCYRVYDADLPEYAAAIDVYTECVGERRMYLHVQEYAAPKDIPEQDTRRRLGELLRAAGEVFELPRERIALKTRARGKGGSKYGVLDRRGETLIVQEAGLRFEVNLFDYLDTGLFLDHRPARAWLREHATGKAVLNLFCYTGSASVHAAAGGASSTTSVDLSATYLDWAARNFTLNGLGGERHRMVQADVMRWIGADRGRYDLIFCDPPTFSNSARAGDFDIQREHVALLRACLDRLTPGGRLLFSTNFRRFRFDADALADAQPRELGAAMLPPDFARDPRIHRVWELRNP